MSDWTERLDWLDLLVQEAKRLDSSRANGEIETGDSALSTIPSEASGSVISTEEPLESRAPSNASSNEPQECPAPLVGDDVLRSSGKPESWDKAPSEDIATA